MDPLLFGTALTHPGLSLGSQSLFGMPVIVSAMVSEMVEGDLAPDFQDRLDAMCAHHVALDLIPLHDDEPGAFMVEGRLVVHPASFERLRRAAAPQGEG